MTATGNFAPSPIRLERQGAVAVIIIDNRPINVGSHAVRTGLLDAIKAIDTDPSIKGAVLIGGDRSFIVGSDLKEFDLPLAEPQLPAVIAAIESSPKPFVAALHGAALGGGYELALGCDARIAAPGTLVGLPETTLGMIPGAGGTQRLPRLTGTVAAIDLITSGRRVGADEALRLGMVDIIAHGDLREEAVNLALHYDGRKAPVLEKNLPTDDPDREELAAAAALRKSRNRPHIAEAIRHIRAVGRIPAAQGLLNERAAFQNLRIAPDAKALRHLFFAEREAGRSAFARTGEAKKIDRVGILGAGTMGTGIALAALAAGLTVRLVDNAEVALMRGRKAIEDQLARRVTQKRLRQSAADAQLGRLHIASSMDVFADCDLVIEAVIEDLSVKRDAFAALDRVVRPGTLLASNTSYLDIDRVAEVTSRPADVLGLHFFSPAHATRLLEVVRAEATSADALATGIALAGQLGKQAVIARNVFGFIGNRIYAAYRRECEFMLEDGALPHEVDDALEAFGFAMGPFAVADMSGLDIAWRMRQAQTGRRDPAARYVKIPDLLCEAGRLGQKAGAGYYSYGGPGQEKGRDPEVEALIVEASREAGRTRTSIAPDTIVRRALIAMVNEAALAIEDGAAETPASIDVTMTNGYGFPRWIGGPVHWARQQETTALHIDCDELVRQAGSGTRRGNLELLDVGQP
ncbi:3-hydroxyacyl-CoA dehydrogenase NAD-binding domain-containing protein [Pelagibacterium lacus]|uniref:3-hydroxyacyl-CoA dehydrogenase n=1 Tax=Pelagibacterium lacus TaxID=2282655 RepID=A0A369W880_9HYPH|nr:3-hydroxyacyl-CoA dehydrogenase NAD-binding domain-containing protein [Pelagibacterium lacus]RDE09570.1 3-hydroxyacyl-CoA dehydrogenase [Pelagibacterium lacus]